MDFLESKQEASSVLEAVHFDLFITVSGNRDRCTNLIDQKNIRADKKIALNFRESSRDIKKNSPGSVFHEKGFDFFG